MDLMPLLCLSALASIAVLAIVRNAATRKYERPISRREIEQYEKNRYRR